MNAQQPLSAEEALSQVRALLDKWFIENRMECSTYEDEAYCARRYFSKLYKVASPIAESELKASGSGGE